MRFFPTIALASLLAVTTAVIAQTAPTIPASQPSTQPIPPLPPVAMVKPIVDDYFGVKVTDPYRYMEDLTNPQVKQWFKAQSDYTRAVLDRIPGRQAMLDEIEKYIDSAPSRVSSVSRLKGGRYFYLKTLAGESLAKLYMRSKLDAPETLLVDTDKFKGPKGEPAAINSYSASPDGHYLCYVISQAGSEIGTLHILDVDAKKDSSETMDRVWDPSIAWQPDNTSFCFSRLQKMDAGMSPLELEQRSQVYLHKIGGASDKDVQVFGIGGSKLIDILPEDMPALITSPNSDWAIGLVEHGVRREATLYAAPISSLGQPNTPWTKVCDIDDQITDFSLHGDDIYLLSHKDADRYKILRTSLKKPDAANAEVVVPEGPTVLRELTCMDDALYAIELDAGIGRMVRVPYGGSPQRLHLPMEGTVYFEGSDPRLSGILLGMTSWTTAGQIYLFDPKSNQTTLTDLQPQGPFDAPDYLTAEEVNVPSYDGVPVPLSIVYKKGLKLDGSNPTILSAYGAYGITSDPGFSYAALAWYNRGGIRAIAHVRGGGEKGEQWHLNGFKLSKPNTWRDLIASAQYLIDQKYTSTPKLGITGGSAGGITIGRALTERPDLFAAAVPQVGVENPLRAETYPNGVPNIPEFGSVKTLEGFEDLYAMDSYVHVREGTAYPAVMLTAGMNDPRVTPWMPAKMAARLQAATTSNKPVLLRVEYANGHGIGASKAQSAALAADVYEFFLWQFGDPNTQPKP
ncbi:MAG: prolyl oligopeptidase family serine peptidase [Planctomycetota bacterium]|nr:prolyl oligopeptidase family serine peptidase [Planctomycetota bacterium]